MKLHRLFSLSLLLCTVTVLSHRPLPVRAEEITEAVTEDSGFSTASDGIIRGFRKYPWGTPRDYILSNESRQVLQEGTDYRITSEGYFLQYLPQCMDKGVSWKVGGYESVPMFWFSSDAMIGAGYLVLEGGDPYVEGADEARLSAYTDLLQKYTDTYGRPLFSFAGDDENQPLPCAGWSDQAGHVVILVRTNQIFILYADLTYAPGDTLVQSWEEMFAFDFSAYLTAGTDTPGSVGADTPEPADTDAPEPSDADTPEPADTDAPEPSDTDTADDTRAAYAADITQFGGYPWRTAYEDIAQEEIADWMVADEDYADCFDEDFLVIYENSHADSNTHIAGYDCRFCYFFDPADPDSKPELDGKSYDKVLVCGLYGFADGIGELTQEDILARQTMYLDLLDRYKTIYGTPALEHAAYDDTGLFQDSAYALWKDHAGTLVILTCSSETLDALYLLDNTTWKPSLLNEWLERNHIPLTQTIEQIVGLYDAYH